MSVLTDITALLDRTDSVIAGIDTECAALEARIAGLENLIAVAGQVAAGGGATAAERIDALIAERVAALYAPAFTRIAEMREAADAVFDDLAVVDATADGALAAGEEARAALEEIAAEMKALGAETLGEIEGATEAVETEAAGWTEAVERRTGEIVGIVDAVLDSVEAATVDADEALGTLIESELFERIDEVANAIDGYLTVADRAVDQAGGAVVGRLGEASEKIANVTEVLEQVQTLTEPFEAFL